MVRAVAIINAYVLKLAASIRIQRKIFKNIKNSKAILRNSFLFN